MKLVIFGLTISSSWGNGHATIWRGLCRALSRRGTRIVFFERDVPYYSAHRDLYELPGWAARALSKLGYSTVPSRAAISGCRCRPRRSCPRINTITSADRRNDDSERWCASRDARRENSVGKPSPISPTYLEEELVHGTCVARRHSCQDSRGEE